LTINIVWSVLDPLHEQDSVMDRYYSRSACGSDHATAFVAASLAWKAALLVYTCYQCVLVRNAPTQFNEGKQIFLAVYQVVFVGAILMGLASGGLSQASGVATQRYALLIGVPFCVLVTQVHWVDAQRIAHTSLDFLL
jgi:hypothetical protein